MLEQDALARNFNRTFARKQSSAVNFHFTDLVDLTAQYSPQIAL